MIYDMDFLSTASLEKSYSTRGGRVRESIPTQPSRYSQSNFFFLLLLLLLLSFSAMYSDTVILYRRPHGCWSK